MTVRVLLEHAPAGGYHTWARGAQGHAARGGVDFSAAEGLPPARQSLGLISPDGAGIVSGYLIDSGGRHDRSQANCTERPSRF
jgi:hypothetical protein